MGKAKMRDREEARTAVPVFVSLGQWLYPWTMTAIRGTFRSTVREQLLEGTG